jgi:hypothetical protein
MNTNKNFNREENDIFVVDNNKKVFIDLFKENKLPILHNFEI